MSGKMLLCGNGLSMNFDSGFKKIMDRLYEAHQTVLRDGVVKSITTNKKYKTKFEESYKSVISALRRINKKDLYNILEEGFIFGQAIVNDKEVVKEMSEKGSVVNLTFGYNQIKMLKSLVQAWKKYGVNGINIEYISILIWGYFAVGEEKIKDYDMEYNKFIKLIRIGDYRNIQVLGDNDVHARLLENIMFNGMNTYLRIMLSTAIFNNGKAIADGKLDNIENLNIDNIREYINTFDSIVTLNYDSLIENIFQMKNIKHVHGQYKMNYKECNAQLIGLKYNDGFINFSDILIGDYIYNKVQRAIINGMNAKFYKKNYKTWVDILETEIKENNINSITVFGLNPNNDQHIFRNIITGMFFAKISNPKINYCYYNNEDKDDFEAMFKSIITFSKELNEYANNIKIEYTDSKNIIKDIFINSHSYIM